MQATCWIILSVRAAHTASVCVKGHREKGRSWLRQSAAPDSSLQKPALTVPKHGTRQRAAGALLLRDPVKGQLHEQ
jgi:hypothetical protein